MTLSRCMTLAMLVWSFCNSCLARELPKVIAEGEWSKPVTDTRGYAVCGRLVLMAREVNEDSREVAVYVELQDASQHVGSSMRIYCDLGKLDFSPQAKSGLRCEMRDKDHQLIAPTGYPFGGRTPSSQWIELPSDATIRMRSSPFGVYRPRAMAITPYLNALWEIPDNDPKEYFLSGTFTVDPEEGRNTVSDPQIWRGTLDLPPVRIVNRPQ